MKQYIPTIAIIFLYMFSYTLQANNADSEYLIKKSTNLVSGNNSQTIFVADVTNSGNYYLNCWILGVENENGSISEYDVYVNGTSVGKVCPNKANWQSISISTGTISLTEGKNTIVFSGIIPEIPNIEFIKLSTDKNKAEIPSHNYDRRIKQIENETNILLANNITSSISDTTALVSFANLELDSNANYTYHENVPLYYTFRYQAYFTEGTEITFSVTPVSGATPMLEVFYSNNPEVYSWSVLNDSLNITIPVSGSYWVRARSYQNARTGIVNVSFGDKSFENVPIYSFGFGHTLDTEYEYNTFTADLDESTEGDPILHIGRGFPDKIVAFNDDYSGTSDHDWYYNSRIRKHNTIATTSVFVNNYSSYDEITFCDVYIGCRNSPVYSYFPNLLQYDAIQSAPRDLTYNCISWSGGITEYWEWPLSQMSQYHVAGNDRASFDLFYTSPRYNGCSLYTRNGATYYNSKVDLWGIVDGTNVEYTHASIKHGADNHPHGYAWESKPGSLARTFHPRESLEGSSYGEIVEYYRYAGTAQNVQPMILTESIAEGLSVLENVEFTDAEWLIINAEIECLSVTQKNTFNTKYQAWKETWDNSQYSSLDTYKNDAYNELLTYCNTFYESQFLVFEKLGNGEFFNLLLVEDLTLVNNSANNAILEAIKEDNSDNPTTSTGETIVRSPYSNSMKYAKQLLSLETRAALSSRINSVENGVTYSNQNKFSVEKVGDRLSIAFSLPEKSRITLSVVDLQGRTLSETIKEKELGAGEHHYQIKIPDIDVCLLRYVVNGNVNVKKHYCK